MKYSLTFLEIATLALGLGNLAHSQPTSTGSISFLGALTDSGGQPLADGNYTLGFRFWNGPSPIGTAVSTNIVVPNVGVTNGVASTAIPVLSSWFTNQTLYLGVSVNGAEMLPRIMVTAVPFAIATRGLTVSDSGNVGIGTSNPSRSLEVKGVGRFDHLNLSGASESLLTWGPTAPLGPTTADGFRIRRENGALFGVNHDYIVFEKTDGNDPVPDGGIAFMNAGETGESKVSMTINGQGRVGIGTVSPSSTLDVNGRTRTTVLEITSDRNAKQEFESVSPEEILRKVIALPITTWSYTNNPAARHLGPMAQDFHAAFGLSEDDKHIATVDADGVALAAIQGLNQKLDEKSARIATLEEQLKQLEHVMAEFASKH